MALLLLSSASAPHGRWHIAPGLGRVVFLPSDRPAAGFVPITRPEAALRLAAAATPLLAGVLARGLARAPAALPRRLRAALAHAASAPPPPALAPLPAPSSPPATQEQPQAPPLAARPPVSLIVPSTARGAAVTRSLRAVLERTDYPAFDMILVLAQPEPPDPTQRRLIARLDPARVRPLWLRAARFNFAAACNHGAAAATAPLLCLLNDDVAPLRLDWLARMVAALASPGAGVIGARLLYPEGGVQHVGIAISADGTCHHPQRFAASDRDWPLHPVDAVTGACLLTPAALWRRLGGLDPLLAHTGNDVDYCLRARAAGARVLLAGGAVLSHDESRSYRRHPAATS